MRDKIEKLLRRARASHGKSAAYAFLPEIIRSLEAMQTSLSAPRARRARMAGALERLVTEDFTFSKSPTGAELLDLADEFASGK